MRKAVDPAELAAPGPGADVLLVDSHCHLDAPQFAREPVSALLARASRQGVRRLVTVGLDGPTSRRAVALAASHDAVWATIGVAPHDIARFDEEVVAELRELARQPRVVAIGEIGLDYHWDRTPRDVQQDVFRRQLSLARELDLPVVIHSRKADRDTASILGEWSAAHRLNGRPLGVMHCYSGDLALARKLVESGFLISLSGVVTYRNAARTHEVAAKLPLSALLLETDAPYLAPDPHRGRRNEPALLPLTGKRVAALRRTDLAAVASATSENAARLFRW